MDSKLTLQSAYDSLVSSANNAWENLQEQTAQELANQVVSPATNIIQNFSSTVSGIGQTQSDVKNISGFLDSVKKYVWVIPVVIILLMLAGKFIFSKKSGR